MQYPKTVASILTLISFAIAAPPLSAYEPAPENLLARQWFQDAGFGIFIHWGIYSELARGEWVMHREEMTVNDYRPLAQRFNPIKYDPAKWVALFKRAGAKYITITSKHHDGFAMWDSQQTTWDIVDATPYSKDVLKMLAEECEKQDIKLMFYHSHLDWTHPDYYPRGRTGRFSGRPDKGDFDKYLNFMNGQLSELFGGDYGDVAGIWFDGWWDHRVRDPKRGKNLDANPHAATVDWKLQQTYELIHRLQPACLIGNNHHVTPFPGEDFQMFERDLPGSNKAGHSHDVAISDLPLETCDTINKSWGYNANDKSVKSTRELVHYLVRATGNNANLLLNVGPRPDGTIQAEFVDRLSEIGQWLDRYGKSIYNTRGGPVPPQAWGVSTHRDSEVYLHILDPPEVDSNGWLELAGTAGLKLANVALFDRHEPLVYEFSPSGLLRIKISASEEEMIDTILVSTLEREK